MATQAEVLIDLTDGTTLTNAFNVGIPATDADAQEARLIAKFDALVGPICENADALREMALAGTPTPMELLAATAG